MGWPDVRCPLSHGPSAREHLAHVLQKAAHAPNRRHIVAAVQACLRCECLTGDPPRRGLEPPLAGHCASVLWVRVLADEGWWQECEAALRHGLPP